GRGLPAARPDPGRCDRAGGPADAVVPLVEHVLDAALPPGRGGHAAALTERLGEADAARLAGVVAEVRDVGVAGRAVECDRLRLLVAGFQDDPPPAGRPRVLLDRVEQRPGQPAPASGRVDEHALELGVRTVVAP